MPPAASYPNFRFLREISTSKSSESHRYKISRYRTVPVVSTFFIELISQLSKKRIRTVQDSKRKLALYPLFPARVMAKRQLEEDSQWFEDHRGSYNTAHGSYNSGYGGSFRSPFQVEGDDEEKLEIDMQQAKSMLKDLLSKMAVEWKVRVRPLFTDHP